MTHHWQHLVYAPLLSGKVVHPRGQKTKEILNFNFKFSAGMRFIFHERLKLNLDYMAKELEWYVRGVHGDVSICEHAAIWKQMLNADGTLTSNYGYQLWGREDNPIKRVITELKNDQDSRRAFAHINRPEHYGPDIRDVPCTIGMQFMVRDGALHAFVTMRSQDAIFGLRNDLPFFWFVADVVAKALNIHADKLYLTVASFHVYERHWAKLREIVEHPNEWKVPLITWEEEIADVIARVT